MTNLENQINSIYESLHLEQEIKDLTEDHPSAKLYRIEQILTGYTQALDDWSDFVDYLLTEGYFSNDDHFKALHEWQESKENKND